MTKPHIYRDESQGCTHQLKEDKVKKCRVGGTLWCGYIIVVLNLVISSLSHYPGVGQMGKDGGSAPGIMLASTASER